MFSAEASAPAPAATVRENRCRSGRTRVESRIKTLNKRRSKGGLLSGAGLIVSLIGFALMLMLAVPTPEGAMADGGANDECEPADVSSWDQPAGDGEKTITSDQLPAGAVWENVCIKPGNNHSNELTQNGYYDSDSGSFTFVGTTEPVADGCYFLVSGIGTAGDLTVTQLAVGAGNACSGLSISHLEANWLSATDPTLVITKVCVDGTGESFGYDVDPDGSIADPSVDCGASSASIVLTADTFHSVTEDMPLPDGWTLTSVLCTGTTESQITDGVSFTPTFDDAIECTFTNTFEVDSGSIQICKDADGLVAGDEFDFNIDGPASTRTSISRTATVNSSTPSILVNT